MNTGRIESVSADSLSSPDGEQPAVVDSAPDCEYLSTDLMRPVPVSRRFSSLQMVFLTVTVSSVLLILLTFFTYLEFSDRDSAIRRIDIKLTEMLDSGSILLADATAQKDLERALLVLAPVLGVPDIQGVAIDLADGTRFTEHGDPLNGLPPNLIRRRDIMHIVDSEPARIGTLLVGLSYDRVNREMTERIMRHAVLAALILAAIIFSIHQSLRLIVMSPMRRLLSSIQSWQEDGAHKPAEWSRNDEFGQLIDAFNRMQTQQQFYQRDLKVALSDAEAADRAKTAFLAIISHELRTPLNAIIGFSDVLRASHEDLPPEDLEEYLDHVSKGGQTLLNMVNDILDITSARAGRLELSHSRFDPIALVQDFAASQPDDRVSVVEPGTAGEPSDVPSVSADVPRLKRVLGHLLDNSLKVTPPEGHIRIGAMVTQDEVRLSVEDTGMSLTVEEYARLSAPFSNSDQKWQNHREGVGLGLSYVHTIIRIHGGSFTLQSNDSGGTTAIIVLPTEG